VRVAVDEDILAESRDEGAASSIDAHWPKAVYPIPEGATPLTFHRFSCSVCSEIVGTVVLYLVDNGLQLKRSSFTGDMFIGVPADMTSRVNAFVVTGEVRSLFCFDLEVCPFFCPECDANYCGTHWDRWDVFDDDGWHDCIRGRCPNGHERMLED